ncbi:MAG: UbiA family prenyltransferase [Parvicellaceae bacterium]
MSSIDSKSISDQNNKPILVKFLALLSIARWYNIFLVIVSLYFVQIFIFDTSKRFLLTLQSINIHLYVFSILFIIMGGYLINSFYDFEKDMINQPGKTYFGRLISKKSCLNIYVIVNVFGISAATLINKEILVFSLLLIFSLWIYSHKLRKKALLGEISASLLMISFFVGLSVLNWRIDLTLFLFVTYIFSIDLTREIIKKMISLKGDLIVGEKSIPIIFGIKRSKYIIFSLMLFSLFAILFLLPTIINKPFSYYFILAFIMILTSIYLLHYSKTSNQYKRLNNMYKSLIGLAILSIVLY